MITEQEQIERRAVVKSALASQRIEGLEPDAKVIEDAEKWTRGEITIAAAIADYKARVRHEVKKHCKAPQYQYYKARVRHEVSPVIVWLRSLDYNARVRHEVRGG